MRVIHRHKRRRRELHEQALACFDKLTKVTNLNQITGVNVNHKNFFFFFLNNNFVEFLNDVTSNGSSVIPTVGDAMAMKRCSFHTAQLTLKLWTAVAARMKSENFFSILFVVVCYSRYTITHPGRTAHTFHFTAFGRPSANIDKTKRQTDLPKG